MRLYVIRHGQSENNLSHCWTGWYDAPLTEKGKEDARKAKEQLEGVHFDKVFSSDLQRAMDTASIVLPGQTFETTPLVREINVGNLANRPLSLPEGEARQRLWTQGYQDYGGESNQQFRDRLEEFLRKAAQLDCENVAVFCHGGCLRTILRIVIGPIGQGGNVLCRNCAIGIFEYADESWGLHSWINLS